MNELQLNSYFNFRGLYLTPALEIKKTHKLIEKRKHLNGRLSLPVSVNNRPQTSVRKSELNQAEVRLN